MVGPMAAVSAIDRAKRSVTARYVLPIANACGSTSSNRNLPPLNELVGAMRQAAGERSGGVFIVSTFTELNMPVFDTTLMGLLGLSAATYLGLKVPEPTVPPA
jgi:hypothetical protein